MRGIEISPPPSLLFHPVFLAIVSLRTPCTDSHQPLRLVMYKQTLESLDPTYLGSLDNLLVISSDTMSSIWLFSTISRDSLDYKFLISKEKGGGTSPSVRWPF